MVNTNDLVDLTDQKDRSYIYSPFMLHFIIEHFHTDLELAVCRQRLFIIGIKEELERWGVKQIQRDGDDLYIEQGKLSVSIATRSMLSTLIHTGLNVETEGTPVKTAGLKEIGIENVPEFAVRVMENYKKEIKQMQVARCKVRGIS